MDSYLVRVWRSAFAIARGELGRRRAVAPDGADGPSVVPPEYTLDVVGGLRALAVQDREVLVLRHVAGYSHAGIAARCGISQAAARVRLHRATGRARRLLEGHRG